VSRAFDVDWAGDDVGGFDGSGAVKNSLLIYFKLHTAALIPFT